MMKMNHNFETIPESYLFSEIAKRVKAFSAENPDKKLIRLGIGDVTQPLAAPVVQAFCKAAQEQGDASSFHGYGDEQGYGFLRQAVAEYYASFGVCVEADAVFISDGAKSDIGNLPELFSQDCTVLLPNPVYPVYEDSNGMAGRKILYMNANRENNFLPMPDETQQVDLIYLCSPNNPTGAVYTKAQLAEWVAYANCQNAVILFDAAYESFVQDDDLPRSIFCVEGAETCAIEVCSLSKTAGFTGTRCGYTVVPNGLAREGINLHKAWLRRQCTKFNGVSYPVQRAAEAVFTPEGQAACKQALDIYRANAACIADTLDELGIWYCGGKHSPYIWLACPNGMDSWQFFDELLQNAGVVGTPGSGFGTAGEGYFRLTAFGNPEATKEAMQRIKTLLTK